MIVNTGTRLRACRAILWKPFGNLLEMPKFGKNHVLRHPKPISMSPKEFAVFQTLVSEVYAKAFGEPLASLPHSKAQSLVWLIYDATGCILSYKTLGNYVRAALDGAADRVNPNVGTLAILVRYVQGLAPMQDGVLWYQYRGRILMPSGIGSGKWAASAFPDLMFEDLQDN